LILTQVGKRSNDSFVARHAIARAAQVKRMSTEARDLKPVFAALKTDPNNAAANLKAGRFICFVKGNWRQGLPLLAKAGDAAIQTAATQDLANPETPDARVAAGDAWWAAAEKESGGNKAALRARAAYWYSAAMQDKDLDGLTRAKVEKRLAEARADESADPKTAQEAVTRRAVAELVGKWKVVYENGNWVDYQIAPDGTVTVLASSYREAGTRLSAKFIDGWFWMDIASNKKEERFRLENGKLTVHHWIQATPLPTPPKAPDNFLTATGTRIAG
jgi:hypothetical protein